MRVPSDLPPPRTERLRLVLGANLGLLALADRLRAHWASHAAANGLTTGQVRILLTLTPGESVVMRSLAADLDFDASNLTTVVDRLEQRGTVERRSDPHDRRVKALVLTAEGERLRAAFWRGLVEDPGPLAPLDEADLEALGPMLNALNLDT